MDPLARAVDDCQALTARMLAAAERGDWETVTTLDAQRTACFDGLNAAAQHPGSLDAVLEEFHALMAMDDRLRARAAAARQAALVDVRKIRERQHGQARYQELAQRG